MAASAVHQLLRVRYGTVDAKKVPVTIRSGREPVVLAFSGLWPKGPGVGRHARRRSLLTYPAFWPASRIPRSAVKSMPVILTTRKNMTTGSVSGGSVLLMAF